MSTLLVTIDGPAETVDLALPGETPIAELMPTLLEMAVSGPADGPAGWRIAPDDGQFLPPDRTLAECGVTDGAVLSLRPAEGAEPGEPPSALATGETALEDAPPSALATGETAVEDEPPSALETGETAIHYERLPSLAPSEAAIEDQAPDALETGEIAVEDEPPSALESGDRPVVSAPDVEARPASGRRARPGSPLERTRRALPRRLGPPERLGRTFRAIFASETDVSTALERKIPAPRPAAVTVARSTTPMERSRAAWRSTDYPRRLDASIVSPRLRQAATIAVVSPKGGVGKTTITALLGSLLAYVRRDRIVAVDTNPDYGSLGPTLTPDHDVFVDDLLALLDRSELTVTQLDANLGRGPDGLMVLPAPTDPQRMARLNRRAYVRVIEYLQTKAGVLVLDCGTGLQEPAAQAAILTADQLVLVSDGEPATATLVTHASKLLLKSGVPLMVVVNKFARRGARLDVEELAKLVARADGMCVVESNPRAAARVAAGTFSWEDPAGPWEVTVRELASALLAQWQELGLTPREDTAEQGRKPAAPA